MSLPKFKKVNLKEARSFAHFWKKLPVPVHPSQIEIKSWLPKIKEIAKRRNPQALVLGATPEYRNLLFRFKINITILDINPFMVKAMSYLVKKNIKEKKVLGDWLKMPFKDNSFDLVMSDSAQDNIQLKDLRKFFKNVYRALKPDGYWFFGASLPGDGVKPLSLENYLSLFRNFPKKFRKAQDRLYYYCRTSIHPRFYNKQTRICSWDKLDKVLEKEYKKGIITKKDLIKLQSGSGKFVKSLATTFPWLSVKELTELLSQYFIIIAQFKDISHPIFHFHQAFILKPSK